MEAFNRFTWRYEYFGGIVHDMKAVRAEPIRQPAWDLLMATRQGNEEKQALKKALEHLANDELRQLVARLKEKGALDQDLNLQGEVYQAPYPLIRDTICSPLRTYLHVTDGCNLRCDHCMFACGQRGEGELGTDQLLEVIRILREARCPELRITGGEPTVRKDLFTVIQRAKELDFYVMLNTNGHYGDSIRRKLVSSGIDAIILSLDGLREQHEERRGKNTFAKVIETIEFLSAHNQGVSSDGQIELTINFTFGHSNLPDFEEVVRLCAGYGVNVNLMPLRPFGTTRVRLLDDMLTPEEFMAFTQRVMAMRDDPAARDSGIKIIHKNFDLFSEDPGQSYLPVPFDRSSCGAAGLGLGINPDGRLNVCGFLAKIPEFQGPSILEVPFYHFWFSPVMHAFRVAIKRYCEPCPFYRKQCVGACKAMAYAATGDLGEQDRYCFAHLLEDKR